MTQVETLAGELLSLMPFIRERVAKPGEQFWRSHLSTLQFFTVMHLHRNGPVMMSELAALLQISKQQLTAIIDRLFEAGHAERLQDAGDRRVVRVALTDAGRALIEGVFRQTRHAMAERLAVLTEEDLTELDRSLRSIKEILGRMK